MAVVWLQGSSDKDSLANGQEIILNGRKDHSIDPEGKVVMRLQDIPRRFTNIQNERVTWILIKLSNSEQPFFFLCLFHICNK